MKTFSLSCFKFLILIPLHPIVFQSYRVLLNWLCIWWAAKWYLFIDRQEFYRSLICKVKSSNQWSWKKYPWMQIPITKQNLIFHPSLSKIHAIKMKIGFAFSLSFLSFLHPKTAHWKLSFCASNSNLIYFWIWHSIISLKSIRLCVKSMKRMFLVELTDWAIFKLFIANISALFHMTNKSLQLLEFRRFTRSDLLNLRNDVRKSFVRFEKRLIQRSLVSLSPPDWFDFFGVVGLLAEGLLS